MAEITKLFYVWILYISLIVVTSHVVGKSSFSFFLNFLHYFIVCNIGLPSLVNAGESIKFHLKCAIDDDCPNFKGKFVAIECIDHFCHIVF